MNLKEWHGLLKTAQSLRETALLWLLGGAGHRVSEAAELKVERLDGAGGYLHVVNAKGGKQRTSILPRPALEALQSHLNSREDGIVFLGRDHGHISTKEAEITAGRRMRWRDSISYSSPIDTGMLF